MSAFQGQIALIDRAGSGVGAALAVALAASGAGVCLIGRRLDSWEQVAAKARKTGVEAACYSADLSSSSELHEVAYRIKTDLGAWTLFKTPPSTPPALSRTRSSQTSTSCIKRMCALPTP